MTTTKPDAKVEREIELDSTDLLDQAEIIRAFYTDYVPLARDGDVEPHATMLRRFDAAIEKARAERDRTADLECARADERSSLNREIERLDKLVAERNDRTADLEQRLADAQQAIRWLAIPDDAWISGLTVEELRAIKAQADEQVALARAATKVTP